MKPLNTSWLKQPLKPVKGGEKAEERLRESVRTMVEENKRKEERKS